jgi:hypothetical protein
LISLRQSNIYREVLVAPFKDGIANELKIVSGFASPTMVGTHLGDILALDSPMKFSLELIIGMSGRNNLSERAISAFLGQQVKNRNISSELLVPRPGIEVHSKIYLWLLDGRPVKAWAGSANYTRLAFGLSEASDSRDEILFEVDADGALEYVMRVRSSAIPLSDGISRAETRAPDEIRMNYDEPRFDLPSVLRRERFAICPLLNARKGEIHNAGAGLNWGQPTESRIRKDRRAAYIPVPKSEMALFPDVGVPFEALYRDGQVLVLAKSQQGGKALTMPSSNEALGQFFRDVLRVKGDRPVETSDLEAFGSDCVVFEKLNDEQFVLHFYPGMVYSDLTKRTT